MALEDRKLWAQVHRDRPGVVANSTNGFVPSGRRGELLVMEVMPEKYRLADEGSYFVATNPTPGTGIAGISAADGNDDLENLLCVYNANTASDGHRIYLDFLQLRWTAAGTNGTNVTYVSKIDSADRYTSGGSAITEVNVNMDTSTTTAARINFGALVSPAATAQRLVGAGQIRSVIAVVGDSLMVDFGGKGSILSSLQTSGTAIAHMYIPHVPVVIGPTHSWLFQINASSQSGASSFEFLLGFWER